MVQKALVATMEEQLAGAEGGASKKSVCSIQEKSWELRVLTESISKQAKEIEAMKKQNKYLTEEFFIKKSN